MVAKNRIYKLKDNISVDPKDYFTKYVLVTSISDMGIGRVKCCSFKYIFIENLTLLDPTSDGNILPVEEFERCFDFYRNLVLEEVLKYDFLTKNIQL